MSALFLALAAMISAAPPPQQAPSVTVVITLSAELSTPGRPPTLEVRVKNEGSRPAPYLRFEAPECFAQYYLRASLKRDGTVIPNVACASALPAQVTTTLAPGAADERVLPLAALFSETVWPKGQYLLDVGWSSAALEAHLGPAARLAFHSVSGDGGPFVLAPVLATVRVARGEEVALPDGALFRFTAHGHKRTVEGGPPSPLIIHGTLRATKDAAPEPVEAHAQLDETRVFYLQGRAFELLAHDYDGWMEVRYFGRVSPSARE